MELLPAIDLRHGAAVRLTRGDFNQEQDYGDPMELAQWYIDGGARWIHVVDLEAARTGVWHERGVMEALVRLAAASSVRVQAGGGIRTADLAAELLEAGVARVVFGTAALEDPGFAARCARRWPGRVAVGLDYRVNEAGVAEAQAEGWLTGSGRSHRYSPPVDAPCGITPRPALAGSLTAASRPSRSGMRPSMSGLLAASC